MQIFDKKKFNQQFTKLKRNNNLKDCYLHEFAGAIVSDKLSIIKREFEFALIYGLAVNLPTLNNSNKINVLPSDFDEEENKFTAPQFDLIVSNMTMQYNNDVVGALVQYYNILHPKGLFVCNLLGGDTLFELKSAMLAADRGCFDKVYNRIIPMIEIKQMGSLMQRAKFEIPVCVAEKVVVSYPDLYTMLSELKGMALGNYLANRAWGFKKDYFKVVEKCYREQFPDKDGKLNATFEILTASGSR